MGLKWPKSGPNHVPSYQTSGIPYVTTSGTTEVLGIDGNSASAYPTQIKFPYVTKFFTITNTGNNPLRMAFTASGAFAPGERLWDNSTKPLQTDGDGGRNYYIIPSASSGGHSFTGAHVQTFDIRCTDLFFKSNASDNSPGDAHSTGFSLIAGLTTIDRGNFPTLTGSVSGPGNTIATGAFYGVG